MSSRTACSASQDLRVAATQEEAQSSDLVAEYQSLTGETDSNAFHNHLEIHHREGKGDLSVFKVKVEKTFMPGALVGRSPHPFLNPNPLGPKTKK